MLRASATEPCTVDNCDRKAIRKGMCGSHYSRLFYHGTVTWQRPRGGYSAVHLMLKTKQGRAADRSCVECGAVAYDWSYDNDDPDELIDSRGRRYSWKLDLYKPRCRSCHFKMDGHVANLGDYALPAALRTP